MPPKQQLALLRVIAAVLLKRDLDPLEEAGLEQAHAEALRQRGGNATIPVVVDELLAPSETVARELQAGRAQIREDNRALAYALRRLTGTRDLGGMFDAPTSRALNLSGQKLIFNLRGVEDEARPLLMACMAAWLQADWLREGHIDKTILVMEEAWAALHHLPIVRWLRESWKLARQVGALNIAVTHRLSDLTAAGADGSEQVKLAQGLLEDTEIRVIFRQSRREVDASGDLLALTGREREIIPTLAKGTALWKIGNRSFVVQHALGDADLELVNTDDAMRIRGRFDDDEDLTQMPVDDLDGLGEDLGSAS
jgi:hypothetical protein